MHGGFCGTWTYDRPLSVLIPIRTGTRPDHITTLSVSVVNVADNSNILRPPDVFPDYF